ncbi:MAG: beta-ketoacyl-[acyl-carrier-protein] synthase family protein [Firmicutes bacterium HGW-Firmicutes-12]|nr:MAG: beta-ketoacyl-[acyl-carrier-protein] synthase family protein [Firmicutes bacterium HGW-Firmicutes-12]
MKRRVVITGIGPATALGIGKKAFSESIYGLQTCLAQVPEEYEHNYKFKSRFFVPNPEFSLVDLGIHKASENMMEEASRLAVLCAKLALDDAGIQLEKGEKYMQIEDRDDCGVIIGIGMSSLQTALESYVAHITRTADRTYERIDDKTGGNSLHNRPRFNRMVIPILMTNSPAAWISILFGIRGFSHTVNASCASGSYALGEAYRNILAGSCDLVLAGGVEALAEKNGAIMRGFDMLSTLTRSEEGRPLPFSRKRSGFLFNEGAGCVLVLEELERAQKRGADIYAELVGYEAGSDAYNIVQMEPSGDNIVRLFQKLVGDIRIDYLNAHGTATIANDDIESRVIQRVFGSKEKQPYINSTKGILGHSIGASGALEAAVTALAIKESRIHGNITTEPLDNLNLPLESIDTSIEYAISASYGFGGHNALLLLRRYEENA